jgi:hypothetical protein
MKRSWPRHVDEADQPAAVEREIGEPRSMEIPAGLLLGRRSVSTPCQRLYEEGLAVVYVSGGGYYHC